MNILEIPVEELQFRGRTDLEIIHRFPGVYPKDVLIVYKTSEGGHGSVCIFANGSAFTYGESPIDVTRKPQKRWRVLPLAEIVLNSYTVEEGVLRRRPDEAAFVIDDRSSMHHHCGELLPKGFTPGNSHKFPGSRSYVWEEWMLEEVEE